MNQVYAKKLHEEIVIEDNDGMVDLISSKFADLYSEIETLSKKVDSLTYSLEQSELLFNIPEVEILSRSKLDHVIINASDPIQLDSNMHQLEENSGIQYRWFGPKRLTKFSVPINRLQQRTLAVSLLSQITDGLYGSIKIYIDGELHHHEIELTEGSAKAFVNLPESNRVQDTVIAIFCPQVFRPSDLNKDSSDARPLSVSFSRLEVM